MKTLTPSKMLSALQLWTLAKPALGHSTHTIDVPELVPSDASATIDPSFPGFAFEQASFYDYSFDANGNPNTFSQNLIKSVLERTGGNRLLRVGGTSGDRAHFNASQQNVTNYPADNNGVQFHAPFSSIGHQYFEAFKNFPRAKYQFQIPWNQWRHGVHERNSMEWAKVGLDAIGLENLYSIEIGNEPNFYGWLSKSKYVERYRDFESKLKQNFPRLQNQEIFQVLDIASKAADDLPTTDAFSLGLEKSASSIKQVAYHYYQGHGYILVLRTSRLGSAQQD